jgi:hypothetical protein
MDFIFLNVKRREMERLVREGMDVVSKDMSDAI